MRRLVLILSGLLAVGAVFVPKARAETRVNLPYFGAQSRMNEAAIFWFGSVDNNSNYADIRLGYTDTQLKIYLHIMDQYLWYDPQASANKTNWDAVTLLLSTAGTAGGTSVGTNEYKLVSALNSWETDTGYESAYRGTSTGTWQTLSLSGFTENAWRGNAPNDTVPDRGWTSFFIVPFSALNLTSPPATGTVLRAAIILHDRDTQTGNLQPTKIWPEGALETNPSTWATLRLGIPSFTPPASQNPTTYTLRAGLTPVVDAHVGGHGNCGGDSGPEFFPTWGSLNYSGNEQMAEQNQWDISDWPCFSKILLNFDLNSLPKNKRVSRAILTLDQFGNSDPCPDQLNVNQAELTLDQSSDPDPCFIPPSYIQVLLADRPWNETTVNWNNGPLAQENVGAAWVDPVTGPLVGTGWKRQWDVSYGVEKTISQQQNAFSVILYSADGEYHSGKYFYSSDIGDWGAAGRPTLLVTMDDLPPSLPNDFDNNGVIDYLDLGLLIQSFGHTLQNELITIFSFNRLLRSW